MTPDDDGARSRRLLFAPELAAGTVTRADLARAEVREASRSRRVPSSLSRAYQRRLVRRGGLGYERETVPRAMAAREAVLGAAAAGPPRLLVRLADGRGAVSEPLREAAAVLAEAGMAHLVSLEPAEPDDAGAELIAELRRAGTAFGMHGLGAGEPPRRLRRDALERRVAEAEARLAAWPVAPEVLVAEQPLPRQGWDVVAARFSVVAAGGEALAWMGYHDTPLFRGDAVWMPAYPPFDGGAAAALDGIRRLASRQAALWVPVALDAADEARDGFAALRRLAGEAAELAVAWPDFLDAVRASR